MSALNHHLQAKAASAVGVARKSGALSRPEACEACGTTEGTLVWHHHDYAKPLDVIPLCGSCHSRVHLGALVEPRTGRMYPKRRRGNRGKNWLRADEDVLTAAWGEGQTVAEIAETLGKTSDAVRGRASKLGLSVSRRDQVVREALELRARMAPHEGPPPTDRVVLVYEVGVDDVAFCEADAYGVPGWNLRWRRRRPHPRVILADTAPVVFSTWPPEGYRWHELPG